MRVERTGPEWHDADSLAEQFGARVRTRARGKRQRPFDCLCSLEADTANTTERLATQPIALTLSFLCFGFDPDRNSLDDLAHDLLRRQCENTREVYENLCRKGYTFPQSSDALAAILEKPSSQQPHELVALLKRHGCGTGESSAGKIVLEAGCTF